MGIDSWVVIHTYIANLFARGPRSNDSQVAMNISSTQIWVSKYHLLIKGTGVI